jgi:hypothetical protein
MGNGKIYSVIDRDGVAPNSIVAYRKYASAKEHKIMKTIVRSYTPKYGGNAGWFDCQDPAGLADIQRSLGLNGGVCFYGESFPELNGQLFNTVWAAAEVSYFCSFKGKVLVNLTSNALTGDVTISQIISQVVEAHSVALPRADNDIHAGSIDLSGNLIT